MSREDAIAFVLYFAVIGGVYGYVMLDRRMSSLEASARWEKESRRTRDAFESGRLFEREHVGEPSPFSGGVV